MSQPGSYTDLAGMVGRTVVLRGGNTAPIKVASARRSGPYITLEGHGLDGTPVSRTVLASQGRPVMASWMVRLSSLLRVAWTEKWDAVVKDMISKAGFPVDNSKNWDAILNNKIHQSGAAKPGESYNNVIQDILTTIILRRSLEKFDPNAGGNDPNYARQSLAEKVSAFMSNLIEWQLRGNDADSRRWRDSNKNEVSGDDIPAGDEAGISLLQRTEDPDSDPSADLHYVEDIQSLRRFRDKFYEFLQQERGGTEIPGRVIALFDLITRDPEATDISKQWMANTGGSYPMYTKTLKNLRSWLQAFAKSMGATATGSRFTQMVNDMGIRVERNTPALAPGSADDLLLPGTEDTVSPGPKARAMHASFEDEMASGPVTEDSQVKQAALFMRALQNEVVRLASERPNVFAKVAKPKVVDSSVLYVVLEANPINWINMNIRFGGPSIAKTPGAGTEYTIDVGLYGPDRSLPEAKIRKQLNGLVFPSMRADVPETYHNLLEKVIRELRRIVWEKAVEYFEVPKEERPSWRHVVKMDVLTLQDVKVNIAEDGAPTTSVTGSVAAASKESSMNSMNRFAALQRRATEDPEGMSKEVEELKQKLLNAAEALEALQTNLDMTPEGAAKFEAPEGEEPVERFAGLKKFAEEEPQEIEAAIQDVYLLLDECMADTENLADALGVDVVAPSETSGGDVVVEVEGTASPEALEENAEEEEEDEGGDSDDHGDEGE